MSGFQPKIRLIDTVRSLCFYLIYPIFTVLFSGFVSLLVFWMPLHRRIYILTWWNRSVLWGLKICCGVKVEIIGQVPDRRFVAVAKHQSQWETYFLQWYLLPVSIVLKQELLRIPFFGWGLALMAPIPIDRSNARLALKVTIERGVEHIQKGLNVLIFPEGTRTPVGERGRYARSGAEIAIRAGVPLLPIAHNSGECWLNKRMTKLPGTITVVIGELIETENKNSRELTAQAELWIETTVTDISNYQPA